VRCGGAALSRWRVADDHVVLLPDVVLFEHRQEGRFRPEGFSDLFGLLFLRLEPIVELAEIVVFRDDVDAVFGFNDEVLEVSLRSVDEMVGESVDVLVAVAVDVQQMREVPLLLIQRDHEGLEPRSCMCDC
jgi:hypothetical protein